MVIATVFLSIIGMSAGLVLGSRHFPVRVDDQGYVPDEPTAAPVACPAEMHDTARRVGYYVALTQVLRVRASTGTTVWICQDERGRLFYQANQGGYDKKWIEGETALFLDDVTKDSQGYHAKAADGNEFSVNEDRLEIIKKGVAQSWDVVPE